MLNDQITVYTPEELLSTFYRYLNSSDYEFDYLLYLNSSDYEFDDFLARLTREFIEVEDFFKQYPALQAVNFVGFDKDSITDQELALEDIQRLCGEIDYSEGCIYFLNKQSNLHLELYYCSEEFSLADIDSSQYGWKSV